MVAPVFQLPLQGYVHFRTAQYGYGTWLLSVCRALDTHHIHNPIDFHMLIEGWHDPAQKKKKKTPEKAERPRMCGVSDPLSPIPLNV